jgi:hypothetical protein
MSFWGEEVKIRLLTCIFSTRLHFAWNMRSLQHIDLSSNEERTGCTITDQTALLNLIKQQNPRKLTLVQLNKAEIHCKYLFFVFFDYLFEFNHYSLFCSLTIGQICDSVCDVERIVRSCLCSESPCEGTTCTCKARPYPLCSKVCFVFPPRFSFSVSWKLEFVVQCLVKQLWIQTADIMKKRNMFRSKCAYCKAEYCHNDIVLFTLILPPPTNSNSLPIVSLSNIDNDSKSNNSE